MEFGCTPSEPSEHPHEQEQGTTTQDQINNSVSLKFEIPPPPPDRASPPSLSQPFPDSSAAVSLQTVDQRMYYPPSGAQPLVPAADESLTGANVKEEAAGGGGFFGPEKKRPNSVESPLDGTDCGQTVGVFSELPSVLSGEPLYPRKRRAGLRKSTETRKNNNRVAPRDFTCGRRCVTDVKPIDPRMIVRLKVVNGVSTERVLRKNKKTVLLDVGQRFGVLQLFVEGHPTPDEKVWVITEKGLAPIPSTAVEHAMGQLTIDVREFPVIARGRVRRNPQKQGTRPKASEPIIECFSIIAGDEGRPLWIDSSLITPELAPAVDPSRQPVPMDPNQVQYAPRPIPPGDPSLPITVQREEDPSQAQQQ